MKFWDSLERPVSILTGFKFKFPEKPFKCSQCQTFWVGLLWLLIFHHFTLLNLALLILIASCAGVMYSMVLTAMDLAGALIGLVQKLVDRL